jgi:hypothetical protein
MNIKAEMREKGQHTWGRCRRNGETGKKVGRKFLPGQSNGRDILCRWLEAMLRDFRRPGVRSGQVAPEKIRRKPLPSWFAGPTAAGSRKFTQPIFYRL